MSDNYPFDREHIFVSVNFPVASLPQKEVLFEKVLELANRRGGTGAGTAEPTAEFLGKPGYTTFGMDIAFEAGDVNIEGFINWVQDALAPNGVQVEYDPLAIISAEEEEPTSRFSR